MGLDELLANITSMVGGRQQAQASPLQLYGSQPEPVSNYLTTAQAAREAAASRMVQSVRQPSGLMDRAKEQYPVLSQYDIMYKNSPGRSDNYLESWGPGEPGSSDYQRPAEFPIDKFGVENFRADTRPIDVLGDVVSHHLINVDPRIKQTYSDFIGSLEPWQKQRLQEQYKHVQKNEGETRSFDDWSVASGIPAYFRGRPFQQWQDSDHMYTPKQREMLDGMMKYLGGAK